ncbi:MAG: nicotinamide riboside transporter PnuC [Candidatus ainarchaeum sp.]|nr:nicotinamide riboside transporter PnuC [Candidatus ainarchaeum sp.]
MLGLLVFCFDDVISIEGEDSFVGNTVFTICTILAIFASLTCELLIAKQSRWNFLVSLLFIEITEFVIFLSLGDLATACISLFFWIPVDIISFVYWTKHKDEKKSVLTKVRKFTVIQDVIIAVAVIIFTVVIGYLLQFVGGEETYVDACVAALGMVNGLLILFRFREQWIVWIIYIIVEGVLWAMNGHYIMLVKTLALLINSIYGWIVWTKYIKNQKEEISKQINN